MSVSKYNKRLSESVLSNEGSIFLLYRIFRHKEKGET